MAFYKTSLNLKIEINTSILRYSPEDEIEAINTFNFFYTPVVVEVHSKEPKLQEFPGKRIEGTMPDLEGVSDKADARLIRDANDGLSLTDAKLVLQVWKELNK